MVKRKNRLYIAIFLSALFSALFVSFDGPYVIDQGVRMLLLRRNMEDIDTLFENPDLDPESRAFLTLTREIRQFAMNELGLKYTSNYTKYVSTDRSYLVDVVSAVRSDSLERYKRKYPIVGEVFYKGFFNSSVAERFASRLRRRGYDVLSRKVGAYSSLGIVTDPLYSYMRTYPEYKLAELIIHEQVHATLWIPGQNQFNEEIANFIGREGAAEYIRRKYGDGSPLYSHMLDARQDRVKLISIVLSVYKELQDCYAATPNKNDRLRLKTEILARARKDFAETYHTEFLTEIYLHLGEKEWNHALLDLYLQYNEDLSFYYQLYEAFGNDLDTTIKTIFSVGENKNIDPKLQLQAYTDKPLG